MDLTPAINALMEGGITGYQLGLKKRQMDDERAKARADRTAEGFTETGEVDPAFFDENSPSYKRAQQAAKFKASASPRAAPTTSPQTIGRVFALRGQPLPKELEPYADEPFDHRYASILPPLQRQGPEMAAVDLVDPEGAAKRNPNLKVPSQFAGNFRRPVPRPGNTPMTPDQQAAYEEMMGLPPGSAAGLTTGNFASGVSNVSGQRAAGERQGRAFAHADEQKAIDRDLSRNKATMKPEQVIQQQISKLARLGDYIDSADQMNMSYPDYLKLRGSSAVGNVAGFLGSDIGKLSPEEEERLAKYSEIGGGFVRDMFETGGKQLTGIEKSLVSRFEIAAGDSPQQIRAKGKGLTDYLEGDFRAKIDAIQRVNPRAAAALRQQSAETLEGVRQRFLNASQMRARGAQAPATGQGRAGAPVTPAARESGKKFGMKESTLRDIRQFPTKGVAGEIREYSKSRNQTRVIKDGKLVKVLDGDQR